jgi:protein-disulfide isomerase
LAAYPQQVALAYVHMPVVAPDSGRAAVAAEAARRQGEFWGMHDALFARTGAPLDEDDLRMVAHTLGLDADQFSADLRDPALLEHVRRDLASAEALGVEGTPTLLVNGRLLPGFQPFHVLRRIVEEELRAAP